MFAELKAAAAAGALGVALIVGAAGGWSVAWLWAENWTIPAARDEAEATGRAASDREWQTKINEANAAAEAERAAKQAAIDRVTRSYLKQIADREGAMSELEALLSKERQENAIPSPTPSPGTASACRPAISRGVRDHLDRIGRPSPG